MIKQLIIGTTTFALFSAVGVTNASAVHLYSSFVSDTLKQKNDVVKTEKKDKKKEKTPYEALIAKGGSEQKGLFTVRHIEDKWYIEVPDSVIGRYLLAVTRFTAVPQGFGKFAGEELTENTIYFQQRDKKTLLLRAYVNTNEADPKNRIYKTLTASTADPIVAALKVIGRNKKTKAQLVDITTLFAKDNSLLSFAPSDYKFLNIGSLQSDRTFIDTMKVYPINLEVASTRTYSAPNTPSMVRASFTGSITIGLNTSIVLLPKVPMRKRLWDKRIGYFTQPLTLFNDTQTKAEHEQVISRFELIPKDIKKYKKGELVEPIKPIIFYIDPATPKQWVPYLKAGIEDWNVAFEAAGFKNAIQAKDCPSDISIDDARYSFLRYLPAEIENAYGPHISDPRSGQIIESHVCWYHNVMNLLTKWYMVQCGPLDKRAQTMKFSPELMGQLIRFVSSHEIGHALGLRHNMGASSSTPVEKLRDKAWVEKHGHTASIMDYARFNYVAQPEDNISEKGLFPRINDYDKWAIKWGYQYRPEFKDEFEEKEKLMTETTAILSKNSRLWFSGEGRDEDPRSQVEDLGDNNVIASNYGIQNLKRVIKGLPTWTKQTNDRTDDLEEMWYAVKSQFIRYAGHVVKNIGGRYLNNLPNHIPYEIPAAAKQKQAVKYIGRQVFEAPIWLYPNYIMEKLGIDVVLDISIIQSRYLETMLSTTVLGNIYRNQNTSPTSYSLTDYLNDVYKTVWKPLTSTEGIAQETRRMLQRHYVELINKILNPEKVKTLVNVNPRLMRRARPVNSDLQLYVADNLDKVEAFCKKQLTNLSGINAQHFKDLLRQIKLVKDRMITVK